VIIFFSIILQPSVQAWAGYHVMQFFSQFKPGCIHPKRFPFPHPFGHYFPLLTITAEPPRSNPLPLPVNHSHPVSFLITGGKYFSQHNHWNYCGPANLAMLLSYLNWPGTPDDIARVIKTLPKRQKCNAL